MFASMIKSSLKCTCIYAADITSIEDFHDKYICRIRVYVICGHLLIFQILFFLRIFVLFICHIT